MVLLQFYATDGNQTHYFVEVWCGGESNYTANIDGTMSYPGASIEVEEADIERDSQGRVIAQAAIGRSVDEMKHAPRETVYLSETLPTNLYPQLMGTSQMEQRTGMNITTGARPADIYVDGELVASATTALTWYVAPGFHTLRMHCDGYRDYYHEGELEEGEIVTIAPENGWEPLPAAQLRIEAYSGGREVTTSVRVKGGTVDMTDVTPCTLTLDEGTYNVTASYGSETKTVEAVVTAGNMTPVHFQFQSPNQSTGGTAIDVPVTVAIKVNGLPAVGECWVDAGAEPEVVPVAGLVIPLRAGAHVIKVHTNGFTAKQQTITVGDDPLRVEVTFVNSSYQPGTGGEPEGSTDKPKDKPDSKQLAGMETMLILLALALGLVALMR